MVTDSFLTFVLEQLSGIREVSSRRMFGGVGLYSGETFFAVIDNDTLFFKVDDETRQAYVKRNMPPFKPMPDMPAMNGDHQVPPGILEGSDAMTEWAAEAVEVGKRAPRKSRNKKEKGRNKKARSKKPEAKNLKRRSRS